MFLKNRVAIVTGGSRGIGRAIVHELVSEGALVVFTFLNSTREARQLVDEVTSQGGKVLALQGDVRDFRRAREIVEETKSKFGRLDFLVNNAGSTNDKALMLMEPEEWQEIIDVNLTGTFNFTRVVIGTFLKQRFGRIVNIASVSGMIGIPRQANYSASKAGIIGFTKTLAKEVADYNITVNAVAPGFIDAGVAQKLSKENKEKALQLIPQKRFGTTQEVAKVAAFLLSDFTSYILGQVIVIDGGLSL